NKSSEWIITNDEGIDVDIGNSFAKTITWNKIKALNYDHPTLSYVVDLTELQEELLEYIGPEIYEKIACIPNRYTLDLPVNFRNLFEKFYCDQKRWQYDDFGKINDDRKLIFYIFMRDVCKHIFSLWDEDIKETHCLEGTWSRLALDSLLNSIMHKLGKTSFPRKPDFWFLVEVAGTIQEILFEETSGPFVIDTDKFHTDRYKLFRFGHDSKNNDENKADSSKKKRLVQNFKFTNMSSTEQYYTGYSAFSQSIALLEYLNEHEHVDISENAKYLSVQNLEFSLWISQGHPLCRVREVYDLKIPYQPVNEESVLQFIHSLWMTRLGLEELVKEIDEIGREIQVKCQGPLKNFHAPMSNLEYPTFPSP
ncbi:14332_t:CDS:2, partial [Gigaspora rosea]